MTYDRTQNAGVRLLKAQKAQRTNLCVGLDVHITPKVGLGADFYHQFAKPDTQEQFRQILALAANFGLAVPSPSGDSQEKLLSGIMEYFLQIIRFSFKHQIFVYKPQASFYDRLGFAGSLILHRLGREIHEQGQALGVPYFAGLDKKCGDIMTTQEPFYEAFLNGLGEESVPGLPGQYGFDTMTITTYMGREVIEPGLAWYKNGKGAIVVTLSSNPSGTEIQDALATPNPGRQLTEKQEPYRLSAETVASIEQKLGRPPTVAELMLDITERVSATSGINDAATGISPLFSVVGSTVKEPGAFRLLRPRGIALVPAFGAQGGKFAYMMPILAHDDDEEMAGQGAICSSSRGHDFAFQPENGGDGNPLNIEGNLVRAIEAFRHSEKAAYEEVHIHYPYAA
ncbi:MAG: orotidine 5'-phosphate decarboxylase / HUMPS family protein [Patescibacteria group bacterium]|jgi:orotidine-5'-phosphate decarboxylase